MPEPLFQLSIHTTHIGATLDAVLSHRIPPAKGGQSVQFCTLFQKNFKPGTAYTSKRGQHIEISGADVIP
jgi:hypothetical protein